MADVRLEIRNNGGGTNYSVFKVNDIKGIEEEIYGVFALQKGEVYVIFETFVTFCTGLAHKVAYDEGTTLNPAGLDRLFLGIQSLPNIEDMHKYLHALTLDKAIRLMKSGLNDNILSIHDQVKNTKITKL